MLRDAGKKEACLSDLSDPSDGEACVNKWTDASVSLQEEYEEAGNISDLEHAT